MSKRRLGFNNTGFTLIELMVAILITIVGMLGLLTALDIATKENVKNQMRDAAVQAAEVRMDRFKATAFNNISTCSACTDQRYNYSQETLPIRLRGFTRTFSVVRSTIVTADGSTIDLGVNVSWQSGNNNSSYEVHSVKSQ